MVNASKKFVDLLLRTHREEILDCFEYGVIQMDVSTKQIVYRNLMRLREKGSAYDCFSENNKISSKIQNWHANWIVYGNI